MRFVERARAWASRLHGTEPGSARTPLLPALPPRVPYMVTIETKNPTAFRETRSIQIAGTFELLRASPPRAVLVFARGVRVGKATPRVEGGRATFEVEAAWLEGRDVLSLHVELADGSLEHLADYDLGYELALLEYETRLAANAESIPAPPGELVFLTQGTTDVRAYLATVAPAVFHLKSILREVGFRLEDLRTILDFGCGSGRLLRGLHHDDPSRKLVGADRSKALVDWARASFPPAVTFLENELRPPLALESGTFDLIYAVSVFTHLSLDCQRAWLRELGRLLATGRPLVLTLHGLQVLDLYRRGNPGAYEEIVAKGYWEKADAEEGSNAYVTFHMPGFAQDVLFADWDVLAFMPGGRVNGRHVRGSFSHVQDVWVVARR